jgi:membrane-associated phospholipid phosphatase
MKIVPAVRRAPWRRRLFLILAASLGCAQFSAAGGSDAYSLSWGRDLVLGGGAIGAFAAGRFAENRTRSDSPDPFGWFDDRWIRPQNDSLDRLGDALMVAELAALPFLMDRFDVRSAATIGVMYAETFALAAGLKDTLKSTIARPRPHSEEGDGESFSFPSGHATILFATAAFSAGVYSRGDSDPGAKRIMAASVFAFAGAASCIRVAAGVHYPTDVLAGAALGTLIGFAVPWFHEVLPPRVSASVGPDRFILGYSF